MRMPSQFECKICGKSFSTKTNLNRHEKNHSEISEEDKFICPECGRAFVRKHDLCRHVMARHSDMSSESHLCPECGKAFARPGLLKKHMEVHEDSANGSEKFICHHCCVAFSSKKFLENHIQVHNGKSVKSQRKFNKNSPRLLGAIQFLEPFMTVNKRPSNKSSSEKLELFELDEIADKELDDLRESAVIDMTEESCENDATTGNSSAYAESKQKMFNTKNWGASENKTEEICPDQYVIDYVKSRMIEAEQDSHRQQFLLSLLPDVREMSNSQFRSFRHQVCSLIDRVLQSDPVTLQGGSSSLLNTVPESNSVTSQEGSSLLDTVMS